MLAGIAVCPVRCCLWQQPVQKALRQKSFQTLLVAARLSNDLCDSQCEREFQMKEFSLGRAPGSAAGTSLGIVTSPLRTALGDAARNPAAGTRRVTICSSHSTSSLSQPPSVKDEFKLLSMKVYTFSKRFASIA